MKNLIKNKFIALLAIGAILFASACKKNNPTQELQQEEYSKVEIIFTQGSLDATSNVFTASANLEAQTILFDANGKASSTNPIQLKKGSQYQVKINFYDTQNKNVNEEFQEHADEHQIFFIPSIADAINYQYQDTDRIGLVGVMTAKTDNSNLDLIVNLRHGIDKTNGKTYTWNDSKYLEYGETDFQGNVKVQTVAP